MHPPCPMLTATLRALYGETDVHVVAPALDNTGFARILALAPNVDPVIGALGALAGGLTDLLTPAVCASPALHAAIASLIGTDAGNRILPWWAAVAPAGWGATHTDALISAVKNKHCATWAVAALIGPCDASAAVLTWPDDIARTVRCWGQATPDHPTAWMDNLTPAEQDRLLDTLCANHDTAAICLPWLPEASAVNIARRLTERFFSFTLDAYVAASPIARARHATVLSPLIQHVQPNHIAALTRLAVVTGMDAAWTEIVRLLGANRWSAELVVAAAPWSDLPIDVQRVILAERHQSNACAAIAFARGVHPDPPPIMGTTACAFFAAVTPVVWSALPAEMQQTWHRYLAVRDAHLAVRSLGLDPMFLACAELNDALIATMRRCLHDDAAVQRTLLPIAVRESPLTAVPAVIAALPKPSDPVAFVQIAGGIQEMPPALRDWIAAHPIAQTAAAAVTVLRVAVRSGVDSVDTRCAALARAFTGWSSEEATALLTVLPDDVRAALRPDSDALADALAHPDRRDAFRKTLNALAALPPAAALPASHALTVLMQATNPLVQQGAGEGLAQALRDHGRIFADIARTLDDVARDAVLPRRDDPHDESALEDLAAVDPLVAHYVAHAWRSCNPTAVLDALAAAAPQEPQRIWRLMPNTIHSAVLSLGNTFIRNVAAPERADALVQTLRAWDADTLRLLLALRMLIDDDEVRRAWGAAMLAQRPDAAASLLPVLREDLHALLVRDPRIVVASADLPPPYSPASVRRRRR